MKNMQLEKQDFYTVDGPLGLSSLVALTQLERHELKFAPFSPRQLGAGRKVLPRMVSSGRSGRVTFSCITRLTLLFLSWIS